MVVGYQEVVLTFKNGRVAVGVAGIRFQEVAVGEGLATVVADKAHKGGPVETEEFLKMGIDTILTNDYNVVAQKVAEFKRV